MTSPIYPEVEIELIGNDGNAFAILGKVRKALQKNKIDQKKIDEIVDEAKSGDYDHLLQTCMKYVNVT